MAGSGCGRSGRSTGRTPQRSCCNGSHNSRSCGDASESSPSTLRIMKVFLAATSLLSSYGGPAFSVSRLATALGDAGAEVGFWAADGSAESTPLLPRDSRVRRLTATEADALHAFGRPDV